MNPAYRRQWFSETYGGYYQRYNISVGLCQNSDNSGKTMMKIKASCESSPSLQQIKNFYVT